MPNLILKTLIMIAVSLFANMAFASLTFHTNKLQVTPGETVRYTLVANAPQGKPCNAQIRFGIPSGTTFVTSSLTGVANGGSQSISCSAIECTWSINHFHQNNGHLDLTLRVNNGIVIPPGAPSVSGNCGLGAGRYVDPGAGHTVPNGGALSLTPTPQPNLTINKTTTSPTHVVNGDQIDYRIEIHNRGTGDATGVTIRDVIPPNTQYISHAGGTPNPVADPAAGNTISWSFGTLAPGQTRSATIKLEAVSGGGTIDNSAEVICSNPTGCAPVFSSAPQIIIDSIPELTISKSIKNVHVNAGDTISYTIDYSNTGSAAATNVVVTDDLPNGLTYVTSTPAGSNNAGTISWNVASVPAGQSGQIILQALVDPTSIIGDQYDNKASIDSIQTNPLDSNEVTVDVVGGVPVLRFDKTVDRTSAAAGEELTYTLSYRNVGGAAATGVVLTDTLPNGVTFVSASNNGNESGGVVTWDLPDILPGQKLSEFVKVEIDPDITSGPLTNHASLVSPNAFQNFVTGNGTTNVRAAPVLTLSKAIDKSHVQAGETVRYTISYENTGTVTANAVTITDDVDGLLNLPASVPNAVINGAGRKITWSIGDLAPHATGSVTFDATVVGGALTGDTVSNQALIEAPNANSATASASFSVANMPALIVGKRALSTSVRPGEEVSFLVLYANRGTAPATDVVIEDALPSNADLVAVPSGATLQGNNLVWNISSIPVGTQVYSQNVKLRAKASTLDGDVVTNHVAITSAETPVAKTASADVDIVSAILDINKVASTSKASPGDTVDYTILVLNAGHTDAINLVIEDHLPPYTSLISASGVYTESNGIIDWTMGTLAAGASTSVTAKVQLAGSIPDGSVLNNSAQARSSLASATDPNTPVKITSAPDLNLSKTVSPGTAKPGETINYTVTYSNSGTDSASDVLLTDQFPAELDFGSATGGVVPAGGVLSWNLGTIATGASGTLTVVGTVKPGVPDGTSVINTASIGEAPGATQLNPKAASATVTVDSKPRFVISKGLVSPSLSSGQEAIYHISVDNQGTADATNVVLEDVLPAELTFLGATSQQPLQTGQKLTWTFPTWKAGAASTIEYRVRVASPIRNGLRISNTATLTSEQTGAITATESSTVSSQPKLTLTKTASAPTVEPGPAGSLGGTLVYTLTYENVGNDTATGITLEDHLPTGVTFVSASNNGTEAGGVVNWTLPDFPAGQAARSVTVTVRANSVDTLKDGTSLHNTSTIDSALTAPVSSFVDVLASGSPRLVLSKTASSTVINAGQDITYTLNYENIGTADTDFVQVADQLPPSNVMTYVSNTGGGGIANNYVSWDIGALAAGQRGSVTVTAKVVDVISDGTPIDNVAFAGNFLTNSYQTFAQPPVTASAKGSINSDAALAIIKSANVSVVQAGGEVTYTINYSNPGHDNATGLVLTDKLDSSLSFNSATAGGTVVNGLVTWLLPDLPAKGSGSVSLVATVASPIADSTVITNTATLSSNNVLPVTSSAVGITVSSLPVLVIEKIASASVVNAGGNVAYTLTYRNTGTDQATDVVIEDQLPAEMSFVSASPTSAGPADTSGVLASGGVVKWNLGTLAVGQIGSLSLVGSVPGAIANGTPLFNSASMRSTRATATSVLSRVSVASAPVLKLEKTTSTTVASPGQDITYTIRYENIGSDIATGVILTDTLPANTSFSSADHGGEEIPAAGSGVVGWPMPDIAANANGTVSITVTPDPVITNGTILTNTATITSGQTSPLSATSSVPVSSAPKLLLQEQSSPSTYVASGSQILYTLVYQNVGNDVATNLTITDTFPPTAIPIAIGSSGSFDQLNNQAIWHLSSLAPGQTATVQFTLQVPLGTVSGSAWNTTSSVVAANAAPVTASTKLRVDSQPQLSLTKVGSNSVEAGQQASYLIEFFNSGNGVANGVTLQDVIPPGWQLVSATNGGALVGDNVQWSLGNILPRSGGSVSVVFNTPIGLADGFVETNTTTILGSNLSPVSAFATTVERSHIELDVNIFGIPSPVSAGERVRFNLLYENLGNADANGVSVTATIPANTTLVSVSNAGNLIGNTITWGALSLPAIMGGQVSFEVAVAPVVVNGTNLVSNATITAASALPDSDSATITVFSSPQLITSKSVDKHEVIPGDTVTYTITVENVGTENASNLSITDQFPVGLELLTAEPNGMVDTDTNTASWIINDLAVGDPPVVVNATARVLVANTEIVNTATVSVATGPNQQITNPGSSIRSGSAEAKPVPGLSELHRVMLIVLILLLALIFIRNSDRNGRRAS